MVKEPLAELKFAIFKNWLDTRPKMETHELRVYPTILGGVSRGFWNPFEDLRAQSAIFLHLKTGTFGVFQFFVRFRFLSFSRSSWLPTGGDPTAEIFCWDLDFPSCMALANLQPSHILPLVSFPSCEFHFLPFPQSNIKMWPSVNVIGHIVHSMRKWDQLSIQRKSNNIFVQGEADTSSWEGIDT